MDPSNLGKQEFLEALATGPETHVIGADEVGYGSWAGALMVCAVAVPKGWHHYGLNDSKKLKEAKREELFFHLQRLPHVIARADVHEIDEKGLGECLHRCFVTALTEMKVRAPNALVVVDGEVDLPGITHYRFPRADGDVPAVMAASVLAKVTRDREMAKLAALYPGYGLGDHKGYGTPEHERQIKSKGCISPIHRECTPVGRILGEQKSNSYKIELEYF